MEFHYNSTNGGKRKLPEDVVRELRDFLEGKGFGMESTKGQLHDALLEYRRGKNGERLMINQLEPVFTYLSGAGSLWPATANV